MIYAPGELVDFLPFTSERPEAATFHISDEHGELVMLPLTLANGGLVPRRKGALHPVFNAPTTPGRYSYKFTDGEQVESGSIRVQTATSPRPKRDEPTVDRDLKRWQGVQARRL